MLFSMMVKLCSVPMAFGSGITIPLLKSLAKHPPANVDDYRGITILPIISKAFEFAILECLFPYIHSSHAQFGFKSGHSCAQAVFLVRKIVDSFSRQGSTVNLCSLDISKAFEQLNHITLFNKLMDRNVPRNLIYLLIDWFAKMETRVKWGNALSSSVRLSAGVRQGLVLSPSLFALYVDKMLVKLHNSGLGCHIKNFCFNSIMYADDILLLAISVADLQEMINLCLSELFICHLSVNPFKSTCMRLA